MASVIIQRANCVAIVCEGAVQYTQQHWCFQPSPAACTKHNITTQLQTAQHQPSHTATTNHNIQPTHYGISGGERGMCVTDSDSQPSAAQLSSTSSPHSLAQLSTSHRATAQHSAVHSSTAPHLTFRSTHLSLRSIPTDTVHPAVECNELSSRQQHQQPQ